MSTQPNPTPAPETSTPAAPLSFSVSAPALRAAVKACAPAMSKDETRFILCGLFFEIRAAESAEAIRAGSAPHVLSIAGCDGRRLHLAQIPIDGLSLPASPARSLSFILPAVHVRALLKDVLPAKVKHGEAFFNVSRRAAALVNSTPVQWLRINTHAGELSAPEQPGNYPHFRQVIPRPTIADDNFWMKPGCLLTLAEHEKDMEKSFKARCLRAAVQSSADRGLPFSASQIESFIKKDVARMIRKARERNYSCYFERTAGNRLLPLPLAIGPTPAFQIHDDGRALLNGADKVSICYGASEISAVNPPAPAAVAFNPDYLIDLNDALTAFDDVPGSHYGPLQAHDAKASFCLRSDHPIDSGKGFSFYAVIMPQRVG